MGLTEYQRTASLWNVERLEMEATCREKVFVNFKWNQLGKLFDTV